MKETFAEDLFVKIRAGYPVLSVNTTEDERAITEIQRAAWMLGDGRELHLSTQDAELVQELLNLHPNAGEAWTDGRSTLVGNVLTVHAATISRLYQERNAAETELKIFVRRKASSVELIRRILDSAGYPVIEWDAPLGFSHDGSCVGQGSVYDAIMKVGIPYDENGGKNNALPKFAVIVFKNLHYFLNAQTDPQWRVALRTLFSHNRIISRSHRRPIVLLQPEWTPHPDVSPRLHTVEFSLPDEQQLGVEVDYVEESLVAAKDRSAVIKCPTELRKDIVRSLRGFTQSEAFNAMAYCAVRHHGFTPDMLPTIHRLKAEALKRDEVLEYVDADHIAESRDIGGYENYLEYIAQAASCYTEKAQEAGLERPRGILLLGVPGTGKSMVGMATAKLLRVPLIKYDFGAVFGGIVGQSESTQRSALRRVKAQGPCVLLIDEADKAFSNMHSTTGDSGVGQRVFGRLLSWMAMENSYAFIVMTMNRAKDVPPELLRAGRLDKAFYTEMPSPSERQQILNIHMAKRKIDPKIVSKEDWAAVVKASEDYVGAELEQIVVMASRAAWAAREQIHPTGAELLDSCRNIIPIAKSATRQIKEIMDYCQDRATPVSSPKKAKGPAGRGRGSIVLDQNASDN